MVQLNPLFISKRFEVLDFDVVQYAHGRQYYQALAVGG